MSHPLLIPCYNTGNCAPYSSRCLSMKTRISAISSDWTYYFMPGKIICHIWFVLFQFTFCLQTIEILKSPKNWQKSFSKIVYLFLMFHHWFFVTLSECNIWAVMVMKCVIHKHYIHTFWMSLCDSMLSCMYSYQNCFSLYLKSPKKLFSNCLAFWGKSPQ